jgi:hypothetical protein
VILKGPWVLFFNQIILKFWLKEVKQADMLHEGGLVASKSKQRQINSMGGALEAFIV